MSNRPPDPPRCGTCGGNPLRCRCPRPVEHLVRSSTSAADSVLRSCSGDPAVLLALRDLLRTKEVKVLGPWVEERNPEDGRLWWWRSASLEPVNTGLGPWVDYNRWDRPDEGPPVAWQSTDDPDVHHCDTPEQARAECDAFHRERGYLLVPGIIREGMYDRWAA